MIEIRQLTEVDMLKAMELKILCWTEESAGMAENRLLIEEELRFWTDWMHNAEKHDDVRLLIGAIENGEMLGVAFGSFAETEDIEKNGIELNGLWVYPQHRNRGVSLMLLVYLLDYYTNLGMEQIVIYNFHNSASNTFYRKDEQMEEKIPVDMFIGDIKTMKGNIENSLLNYMEK